jgi:hypothetical protein
MMCRGVSDFTTIVYKQLTLAAVGEAHSVLDALAMGQVMQSAEEVFAGRHLVFSAHGPCALSASQNAAE